MHDVRIGQKSQNTSYGMKRLGCRKGFSETTLCGINYLCKQKWCSHNAHQRETSVSSNDSPQLCPFSKWENLLPEVVNSFLLEQFLKVWNTTFTTLGELPWVLLILLSMCIYCIMCAMPKMNSSEIDLHAFMIFFSKSKFANDKKICLYLYSLHDGKLFKLLLLSTGFFSK